MAYYILPLYSDSYYDYSINLGTASFRFEFTLSKRQNLYHFSIFSEDGGLLYAGLPLLYKEYSEITLPGADGVLALLPYQKGQVFDSLNATDVPNKFALMFFED